MLSCINCTLCQNAKHPRLKGRGTSNAPIMIISDYVHAAEDIAGEIFVDIASRNFLEEITKIGINLVSCYVTKAIKCYVPDEKSIKQAHIKACLSLLMQEIEQVKPKYILVLGSTALKITFGKTAMKDHRGKEYLWNGIKCLTTYSPGVVLRQPKLLATWRADLNYFHKMTTSVWQPSQNFKWRFVQTKEDVADFLTDIEREKRCDNTVAYDIETDNLHDTDTGKLLMLGIATNTCSWIFNLEFPETAPSPISKKAFSEVFTSGLKCVAHNGKFDNRWLKTRGIETYLSFDTYLASYCLNVTLPHDLKYLARTLCGAGEYGIDTKKLLSYTFEQIAAYCAMDTYYTRKLYFMLKKELLKNQDTARIFTHIMMPGTRVLEKLETKGAYIDRNRLILLQKQFKERIVFLQEELNTAMGETINWNSPKQVAHALFDVLNLPRIKENSTDVGVLLQLALKHPLPAKVLELRKTTKALTSFLNPWLDIIDKETSYGRQPRIHTTYNIAKTATGRLSSEKPNLQQVPRLKEIRTLICVPSGKKLVEVDASQIELRVAAFIADSETMKKVYRNKGDIHTETACAILNVKPEEVTKEHRTTAKSINFGFIYGMWWKAFKEYAFNNYSLTYTDKQAQYVREAFFRKYYELSLWHERAKREVYYYKGVRSPLGRFRHLPNIDSVDKDLRGEAERQAINTPVQSTASDITMLSMIEIDKRLDPAKAFIFGQVHDALLIECDTDYAEEVARICKYCMEERSVEILKTVFGVEWTLPLIADVKIGEAWSAGTEWVS